ncbi:MAG: HD domain-containing protein [Firmicutes bacterium]|nr:HD domain-containing protein [Bacillota bacterium]
MMKIPTKIFITVFIAGIIGIVGEIVLKYDIDMLSENYNEISSEHIVNRDYINDISVKLYRHQTVIVSYSLTADNIRMHEYSLEEKELREDIKELLYEFGERMEGDRREQLYHTVYSNYYGYLQNADILMQFGNNDSKGMTEYYTLNVMADCIKNINEGLDELDSLTIDEMEIARVRMDGYIRLSQISEIVSIACIIAATMISLIYCLKVTTQLDNHKQQLEIEVDKKTKELREKSEKMIALQNDIIIGVANIIENRDGDTGEHVKRTSQYVEILANEAMKRGLYPKILTKHYVELLIKAAPMHDIGKIAVPDSILQKPGRLTNEEFEVIKNHAPEGGRIIKEVMGKIEEKEYVDIAYDVATSHHEKWNGAGYPHGLAGENIPLCARIMALADVFDALVSKRCYKEPMSYDKAFGLIEEEKGTHFDPELAQIFIELREEIEKIAEGYK